MTRHESPHIRTTVGQNIRRYRKALNLTQRDLADAVGSDPISVSRWERGKVMPRPETIDGVASILGVLAGDLYQQHTGVPA